MIVIQIYTCVKIHRTLHWKGVGSQSATQFKKLSTNSMQGTMLSEAKAMMRSMR